MGIYAFQSTCDVVSSEIHSTLMSIVTWHKIPIWQFIRKCYTLMSLYKYIFYSITTTIAVVILLLDNV